ncbi:MAG TPA: hypothetical protein VM716_11850 [Gemmatimonadales bacterium]|nr:hypothetical protein [Gemmatimonadales bacterium]
MRAALLGVTVLLAIPALTGGPTLAAQEASSYVPLDDWTMPYVEHLITTGVIADPSPLTRPLRRAELLRALEAVDTLRLNAATTATVHRLQAALGGRDRGGEPRGPHVRVAGGIGVAAANYARRDALSAIDSTGPRQSGSGHGTANADLELELVTPHVIAVTHPRLDTRLKYDPDWFGKKDRVIAGRTAEAYLSAQWKLGEVFFGRLDRNWGPPGIEGLLLSANPYGLDHFAFSVGTATIQLQAMATQLDDRRDSSGVVHRFMTQHRVLLTPGRWGIALWEGSVLSGPSRSFEPWYLNALNLGLLEQFNNGGNVNSFVGLDVQHRGDVSVYGQLLLDDIQVDRANPTDKKPPSYAVTAGAAGALGSGSAAWRVWYTRVTNLTYRNEDNLQVPLYHFLGTGRNFDDYDQLTVTMGLLPRAGLLLTPELTYLRQGEGDPRLPHPPVSAYPTTPTIFQGVVEHTVRLALSGSYAVAGRVDVAFNAGVHRLTNFQHVTGDTRTRFLGSVGLTYRFQHVASVR